MVVHFQVFWLLFVAGSWGVVVVEAQRDEEENGVGGLVIFYWVIDEGIC